MNWVCQIQPLKCLKVRYREKHCNFQNLNLSRHSNCLVDLSPCYTCFAKTPMLKESAGRGILDPTANLQLVCRQRSKASIFDKNVLLNLSQKLFSLEMARGRVRACVSVCLCVCMCVCVFELTENRAVLGWPRYTTADDIILSFCLNVTITS